MYNGRPIPVWGVTRCGMNNRHRAARGFEVGPARQRGDLVLHSQLRPDARTRCDGRVESSRLDVLKKQRSRVQFDGVFDSGVKWIQSTMLLIGDSPTTQIVLQHQVKLRI